MKSSKTLKYVASLIGVMASFVIATIASGEILELTSSDWLISGLATLILAYALYKINDQIGKSEMNQYKKEIEESHFFQKSINGLWIERFLNKDGHQMFGLIVINYAEQTREVDMIGFVYSTEGNLMATWDTSLIYLDQNKRGLFYIYKGQFLQESLVGQGYGAFDFIESNDGNFYTAKGTFKDDGTNYKPFHCSLELIEDEQISEILGTSVIKSDEDRSKIIAHYM